MELGRCGIKFIINSTRGKIMAYVSQETKASIVEAVKPILKKYGIKASFAVNHHSTFVLNIKSGILDFIANNNEACLKNYRNESQPVKDNINVNVYWIDEQFTDKPRDFLNEIMAAIKSAGNWFDKSDPMTDYFYTAFYIDINIGKWNSPYELVKG